MIPVLHPSRSPMKSALLVPFVSMALTALSYSSAVASVESGDVDSSSRCTYEIVWEASRGIARMHPKTILLRESVRLAYAHAILVRAEYYYWNGDRMKAMSSYLSVLEIQRDNVIAYMRLGDLLTDQRKYAEALMCYERAKSAGYLREDVFIKIAQIQTRIGDHAAALATVHDGVQAVPSSSKLQSIRGWNLIELGSIKEGLNHLSKAIELDDSNVDAYLNRAYGYALLKRWGEAWADLDRGLLLEPQNVYFLTDRGGVRLFSGDIEGAINDLSNAIVKDEERAGRMGAFWYRSLAYRKLGEAELAAVDARKAQDYPDAVSRVFQGAGGIDIRPNVRSD